MEWQQTTVLRAFGISAALGCQLDAGKHEGLGWHAGITHTVS